MQIFFDKSVLCYAQSPPREDTEETCNDRWQCVFISVSVRTVNRHDLFLEVMVQLGYSDGCVTLKAAKCCRVFVLELFFNIGEFSFFSFSFLRQLM